MSKEKTTVNKKFQVGIVGLGHQSLSDHIPAIKSSPDVELVAVVEVDNQKLKSFLKENKGIKGYNRFEDLIKNHELDFVVIAVPHHLHYELTKKVVENKINVLKEKPFVTSIEEAKKLKSLAAEKNVQIMVTLQRRFNPIYSTFFQLIDKIGNPFCIDARYTLYTQDPERGWRADKKLAGGGCIIDMGYHMIDLLIWYFGLPDKIFAEMSSVAKEGVSYNAEDTARIVFVYEDRRLWGSLFVSRVVPPKQECLNLYGTRGIIHLERGKIERCSLSGEVEETLTREHSWPSAAQDQIEYFVKVIRGERENIGNPESHLRHLAFIEAAYKSKEIGKYVNPKNLIN